VPLAPRRSGVDPVRRRRVLPDARDKCGSNSPQPHAFNTPASPTLQECEKAAAKIAGTNPETADGSFVPGVVDGVQPRNGRYYVRKAERRDGKWYFPEAEDDWLECREAIPRAAPPLPVEWKSIGAAVKLN
jgi:hypothetical protein